MLKAIFIIYSLSVCVYGEHFVSNKTCLTMLRELADKHGHAMQCTTRHAVPVAMCNSCQVEFADTRQLYDLLIKTENCSKEYIDADRINIVKTTQTMLTDLWDKAHCPNCFEDNHLEIFTKKKENLTNCLNDTINDDKCKKCAGDYLNLNEFYKSIDEKNNGNICYDMLDAMNRTRVTWSKDLKCCQRIISLTAFVWTAVAVGITPILLFYVGVFAITKRQERNHGVLNTEEPALDSGPSTSTLITAAILSTSSPAEQPITEVQEKAIASLLTTSDDESSDDEPKMTR